MILRVLSVCRGTTTGIMAHTSDRNQLLVIYNPCLHSRKFYHKLIEGLYYPIALNPWIQVDLHVLQLFASNVGLQVWP